MKLNEEAIKQLVLETLSESIEEDLTAAAKTGIATDTKASQADAAVQIAIAKDLSTIKALLQQILEKQGVENPVFPKSSPKKEEPKLQESFQITKGRLREIIVEEMKRAKKQG